MVTGGIDGRRARGRQRLKYLDSLCDSLKDKVSPTQLIRASEDRGLWQRMVANVVDDGTATRHDIYVLTATFGDSHIEDSKNHKR